MTIQTAPFGATWSERYSDARHHKPLISWNYCVKHWFRRCETSVLFGPSNCGKSALVGHLGSAIISGNRFFGAKVQRGIVIHVGAEAPESILDRMNAYNFGDDSVPYLVRMSGVDLSDSHAVTHFITELKACAAEYGEQIVLVVFDTLARSIGSTDENCSTAMTAVAESTERIARTLNVHCMLVHHTGKDTDRGGRGSSARRGAVDTEICLLPQKDGTIQAVQVKQRTMQQADSVRFKTEPVVIGIDEDGDPRTTVRAVEVSNRVAISGDSEPATDKIDRRSAVLTALHVWSMLHTGDAPFKTRHLVEALPDQTFAGISEESRIRAISRILGDLASQPAPPIAAEGKGTWRLTGATRRSGGAPADIEPRHPQLQLVPSSD